MVPVRRENVFFYILTHSYIRHTCACKCIGYMYHILNVKTLFCNCDLQTPENNSHTMDIMLKRAQNLYEYSLHLFIKITFANNLPLCKCIICVFDTGMAPSHTFERN